MPSLLRPCLTRRYSGIICKQQEAGSAPPLAGIFRIKRRVEEEIEEPLWIRRQKAQTANVSKRKQKEMDKDKKRLEKIT